MHIDAHLWTTSYEYVPVPASIKMATAPPAWLAFKAFKPCGSSSSAVRVWDASSPSATRSIFPEVVRGQDSIFNKWNWGIIAFGSSFSHWDLTISLRSALSGDIKAIKFWDLPVTTTQASTSDRLPMVASISLRSIRCPSNFTWESRLPINLTQPFPEVPFRKQRDTKSPVW